MQTRRIDLLNGPNMNLLGQRQPELYGHATLVDVEARCRLLLPEGFTLVCRQSNHEGVLIDWIHEAREAACAIVINPAGFTTGSVALLDALLTFEGPVVEVHLTNIHRREAFRRESLVSLRADGVIAGLGVRGYEVGVQHVLHVLQAAAQGPEGGTGTDP